MPSFELILPHYSEADAKLTLLCRWHIEKHFLNTLGPWKNGPHFTDDTFKCIFWNENVGISIKISLKFVPKGPINNIPALFQVMAWCQPLPEPMKVTLMTHIYVTWPQWINEYSQVLSNDLKPLVIFIVGWGKEYANKTEAKLKVFQIWIMLPV